MARADAYDAVEELFRDEQALAGDRGMGMSTVLLTTMSKWTRRDNSSGTGR
jgi:hypothetical protein